MSSVAPPPNPSLIAIILLVRSRHGFQRLVFHYPPKAPSGPSSTGRADDAATTDNASTTSSDSDGSSSEDDDVTAGHSSGRKGGHAGENESVVSGLKKQRSRNPDDDEDESSSPGDASGAEGAGGWRAPWDTVLGFRAGALGGLLSPGRCWHKRRFELGIGECVFLGWPVFVREDGSWQKRKKDRRKQRDREGSGVAIGHDETEGEDTNEEGEGKGATESKDMDDSPQTSKDAMTMFNVVFVLNPPILDYPLRVKEMYEHVVKKFGRALKYEQARVDYVWREAQLIVSLKEKARENRMTLANLYSNLLSRSSLARAISSVYLAISTSRIASVNLDSVSTSLQIPPITSISVLPSATDRPTLPGLWLTTADSVHNPDDSVSFGTATTPAQIARHFALLLLENESSILKDVEASDGKLGAPLAHYIRCSKPTKSFSQIATMHNIPLSDIQLLSQHLIYWRRARAIPPLNQRDTYIVSPNADMKRLAAATKAYEVTFPTLPSLPKMLSALSGPPRLWGSLIPSKDHKEAYFMILAWLLRGGWVCQLRSFAWVKVDAEIKEAVHDIMRHESEERQGSTSSDQTGEGSEQASPPKRTRQDSALNGHHMPKEADTTASLVLSPQKASPVESRYLDYVGENLSDEELRQIWPFFVKYFNGHDALEKIPVRENMKKRRVWELLGRLGHLAALGTSAQATTRDNVLLVVRHW